MTVAASLDAECLALVRAEIDRRGSIKAVAAAIGYARPSLSLAMRGRYEGSLDAMSLAIRSTLASRVACPHLASEIAASDCLSYRTRTIPTAEPHALKHWASCRKCPANPNRRSSS